MKINPKTALQNCDTLMLDMDGTVLDLAFDNYVWKELVPEEYAQQAGISKDDAREFLFSTYRSMEGQLDWYCLDHWSELLDLDIIELHRREQRKIGYLDGARDFLQTVADDGVRVLMVTNSHQGTLDIKSEVTGIDQFFDHLYTAHDLGYAKEDQSFWHALQEVESFDPETTLFVDDTLRVLESARKFGIKSLLSVTCPDSRRPAKSAEDFAGVERVADMICPAV